MSVTFQVAKSIGVKNNVFCAYKCLKYSDTTTNAIASLECYRIIIEVALGS
jgi:hypothetical protein